MGEGWESIHTVCKIVKVEAKKRIMGIHMGRAKLFHHGWGRVAGGGGGVCIWPACSRPRQGTGTAYTGTQNTQLVTKGRK